MFQGHCESHCEENVRQSPTGPFPEALTPEGAYLELPQQSLPPFLLKKKSSGYADRMRESERELRATHWSANLAYSTGTRHLVKPKSTYHPAGPYRLNLLKCQGQADGYLHSGRLDLLCHVCPSVLSCSAGYPSTCDSDNV